MNIFWWGIQGIMIKIVHNIFIVVHAHLGIFRYTSGYLEVAKMPDKLLSNFILSSNINSNGHYISFFYSRIDFSSHVIPPQRSVPTISSRSFLSQHKRFSDIVY